MELDQLRRRDPDRQTRGLVLLLHGGHESSDAPVRDGLISQGWGQTTSIQRGIWERAAMHGLSTWALRHSVLGWNDDAGGDPAPVPEARRALEVSRDAFGGVPIVLVGHSMGGRTAVRVADDRSVVGVVGLAPWLPKEEPAHNLAQKHLRVAHAKLDHLCGLATMKDFLQEAEGVAAGVEVESMGLDVHYLVRESRWQDFALRHAIELTARNAA